MKYLVEVFWRDEDEGSIAVVPDLLGCSASGSAPEEAVREVTGDATEAWIAALGPAASFVPCCAAPASPETAGTTCEPGSP